MGSKNVKLISEIKNLEDLNKLKLEKRYTKELKKLELQASLTKLQSNLSPEKIKETITYESQNFIQDLAVKLLPSFILKMLRK